MAEGCTCNNMKNLEGSAITPDLRRFFRCNYCMRISGPNQNTNVVGEGNHPITRIFRGEVVRGTQSSNRTR
ncbi:MAG: hypothetical protein HW405_622 [Candidatus Berkelbacteria bacterium]|nr:hypothetical protein [Candidatus Berkelbacteria bacterium]